MGWRRRERFERRRWACGVFSSGDVGACESASRRRCREGMQEDERRVYLATSPSRPTPATPSATYKHQEPVAHLRSIRLRLEPPQRSQNVVLLSRPNSKSRNTGRHEKVCRAIAFVQIVAWSTLCILGCFDVGCGSESRSLSLPWISVLSASGIREGGIPKT